MARSVQPSVAQIAWKIVGVRPEGDREKNKSFFNSLVSYMASNKVMVLKLEGENAVEKYRKLMGSTDPKDADTGTIRELYAENKERNSVHGSDSIESAETEIKFFFG